MLTIERLTKGDPQIAQLYIDAAGYWEGVPRPPAFRWRGAQDHFEHVAGDKHLGQEVLVLSLLAHYWHEDEGFGPRLHDMLGAVRGVLESTCSVEVKETLLQSIGAFPGGFELADELER